MLVLRLLTHRLVVRLRVALIELVLLSVHGIRLASLIPRLQVGIGVLIELRMDLLSCVLLLHVIRHLLIVLILHSLIRASLLILVVRLLLHVLRAVLRALLHLHLDLLGLHASGRCPGQHIGSSVIEH